MSFFLRNFAAQNQKKAIMTAVQLDADILRNLGIIAKDENMLDKVAKYLRRVVKQMTDDPTLMSKEEFFARVEEAKKGPSHELRAGEDLTDFLRRRGYEL